MTKPVPTFVPTFDNMTVYQAILIDGGFTPAEAREMEDRAVRGEPIGPANGGKPLNATKRLSGSA